MLAFFGLNNGFDAINIEKRKIHELLTLTIKGKIGYSDAYKLSLSERRYMIDLLTDNVKETTDKAVEMDQLARLAKEKKIRKIEITENKLIQEKQINDQRKRAKIS
jgi:tRNA splicing endonuclease